MRIKTQDLSDGALNWAVAKLVWPDREVFVNVWPSASVVEVPVAPQAELKFRYEPSTNWSQGGPIIEREKIGTFWNQGREEWQSYPIKPQPSHYGPTPLIAALRCYVASRLGDEVDVPEKI
jgi:hypothetical protein